MTTEIPSSHPRAKSLGIREKLIEGFNEGIVACSGLIAHGRGEAFDYLLGERTINPALKALKAAAAMLLAAEKAVISVNGNSAILVPKHTVKLANIVNAEIEVNLFYRSTDRELRIRDLLTKSGAHRVLGVGDAASATISELQSERRRVDPEGILVADIVLVPLEDGDRTEALVRMGKKVIAIDLNPLSRTSQRATITIVDNITRAMPKLVEYTQELKEISAKKRENIVRTFDNKQNLAESIRTIEERLSQLAKNGEPVGLEGESLEL